VAFWLPARPRAEQADAQPALGAVPQADRRAGR
jgi:hypothetical protein